MLACVLLACIWPSPSACKLVSSSILCFAFYSTQNMRPDGGWVLNSSAWPWKTFMCWFCSTFVLLAWLKWTSPFWTRLYYTVPLQVLPLIFHPLFCLLNLTCLSKSSLNVAGSTEPFGICSCQRDFSWNSCCTLFTLNFGHLAATAIHRETLISVGTKALFYTSSGLPAGPSLPRQVYSKYWLHEWMQDGNTVKWLLQDHTACLMGQAERESTSLTSALYTIWWSLLSLKIIHDSPLKKINCLMKNTGLLI